MLDSFEIISTSGVVLWSKHYVPVGPNVLNGFVKDIFIEERSSVAADAAKPSYRKDGYTLKWTTAKDLGLIFVVCHG
jgi:signal recognition particle receptor subunit alpha